MEQPSTEAEQEHQRADSGDQSNELRRERSHAARSLGAPRAVGANML
jgi:hypothetical protein